MKKYLMAAAMLLAVMNGKAQTEQLSINDFTVNAGEQVKADFNLTNPDKKYCALQFDLALPDGLSIPVSSRTGNLLVTLNNDEETGRTVDHTVSALQQEDGSYRFVIISLTNAEFYETAGAIGTITVDATGATSGTFSGRISGVIAVQADGTKSYLPETQFNVTVNPATGISSFSASHPADVYDLQGNKVRSQATGTEGLARGVYVVGGQKVVVK